MAAQQLALKTGLKDDVAALCVSRNNGDFRTALASFVQSHGAGKVKPEHFSNTSLLEFNKKGINDELKVVYFAVQEVLNRTTGTQEQAWKALQDAQWNTEKAVATLPARAGADSGAKKSTVPLKHLPHPTHFTGCFLDMPLFVKEEIQARATIFNMDRGFMSKATKEQLRTRMLKWVDIAGAFHRDAPVQYYEIVDADEETTRVIIKDVERTFFHQEHRTKLINFLFSAFQEFKTYGQPMSFLAAICLLALDEQETMAVLRKVAKEYIPKHWAPEAVGFATNAWVVEAVLQKRFPDVAAHFMKMNFWPDTYMQKILSGLSVHVLPFELMFSFLDSFISQGFVFLVKFELAIVEHFRHELLNIRDSTKINELHELMRLDNKVVQSPDMKAILQRAQAMDSNAADLQDLDGIRMEVYDTKILPRLNKAPKEPEFEPCGLCEKEKPSLWCETCELAICAGCNDGNKGGHNKSAHAVEKY
jgi:hypothetical protein